MYDRTTVASILRQITVCQSNELPVLFIINGEVVKTKPEEWVSLIKSGYVAVKTPNPLHTSVMLYDIEIPKGYKSCSWMDDLSAIEEGLVFKGRTSYPDLNPIFVPLVEIPKAERCFTKTLVPYAAS